MTSFIQELKDEGVLKMYHDYRSGSFNDWSGNGYDGTPTGVVLKRDGAYFDGSSCSIDCGHEVVGGGAVTLLAGVRPYSYGEGTHGRLLDNSNLEWWTISADAQSVRSDGSTSTTSNTGIFNLWNKADFCVRRNITDNSTDFFIDGQADRHGLDSGTPEAGTTNLLVGNRNNNDRSFHGIYEYVLVIDRELTDTEIAQITGELQNVKFPTKTISRKKDFRPDELEDGDMEKSGTSDWIVINGIMSKEPSDLGFGSTQYARVFYNGSVNPYFQQATIHTIGKRYKLSGYYRTDGSVTARIGSISNATNLGSSTDWSYFEISYVATDVDSPHFYALTTSAGYAEYDNLQIIDMAKSYSPTAVRTDWGAKESIANETSGFLSNTPFKIDSGSWEICTDTINNETVKVIECVSSGLLYLPVSDMRQTPSEAAYGTWEFYMYKGNDAGEYGVFLTTDTLSSFSSANDCWYLRITSDEEIGMRERSGGGSSTGFLSSSGILSINAWHKIKITRTSNGIWTTYVDGSIVNADQYGTNPYTDNSEKNVDYFALDLDSGDRIAYSDLGGDHSIAKHLGVV